MMFHVTHDLDCVNAAQGIVGALRPENIGRIVKVSARQHGLCARMRMRVSMHCQAAVCCAAVPSCAHLPEWHATLLPLAPVSGCTHWRHDPHHLR
jgi:hypothetical protein